MSDSVETKPGPRDGAGIEVDFDPYSPAHLDDPFPAYEELRRLGPVLRLSRYDCWAALDYDVLDTVLNDYTTFSSAAGVGLANYHKDKPWRPKSIILETDPPDHDRARRVLNRVLSRPAMERMRTTFTREAEKLVDRVVSMEEFDGVRDLSEVYPLKVFPDAVGLTPDGRDNLLLYGDMAFNAQGPRNRLYEQAMENADPVINWIMGQCSREALTEDGLGAGVFEAVDRGEVSEQEAGMLVRSLLSAGVDTTINAIGNALYCFARYPEQWELLKRRPELARGVMDEVLRFEGAVMYFYRTTTRDVELGGCRIPRHEKVLAMFSAGSRDPKRWPDAGRFLIDRDNKGHLGFGGGVHTCVGQMVARIELELVLSELLRRVDTLEMTAPPVRRYNNALRGLDSLPLRVTPRALP